MKWVIVAIGSALVAGAVVVAAKRYTPEKVLRRYTEKFAQKLQDESSLQEFSVLQLEAALLYRTLDREPPEGIPHLEIECERPGSWEDKSLALDLLNEKLSELKEKGVVDPSHPREIYVDLSGLYKMCRETGIHG